MTDTGTRRRMTPRERSMQPIRKGQQPNHPSAPFSHRSTHARTQVIRPSRSNWLSQLHFATRSQVGAKRRWAAECSRRIGAEPRAANPPAAVPFAPPADRNGAQTAACWCAPPISSHGADHSLAPAAPVTTALAATCAALAAAPIRRLLVTRQQRRSVWLQRQSRQQTPSRLREEAAPADCCDSPTAGSDDRRLRLARVAISGGDPAAATRGSAGGRCH